MQNTLSIIIPFFKGESFILKLLQSLINSYQQSAKIIKFEILVVVDSPQSDILILNQFIKENSSFDIRIFKNTENLGVAKTRDRGIELSKGNYITFIDQDDNVCNSYFAALEDALENNADLYLQNGYIHNIVSNKRIPIFYYKPSFQLSTLILDNYVLTPALIIVKREVLIKNNICFNLPFDDFKGIDDWYFILQILIKVENINWQWVNSKNLNYCIHNSNYSNDLNESIKGSIKLLNHILTISPTHKALIKSRISTLEFSHKYYVSKKLSTLLRNPFKFLLFLLHYSVNFNRMIRYIHRCFIGLKIRS